MRDKKEFGYIDAATILVFSMFFAWGIVLTITVLRVYFDFLD